MSVQRYVVRGDGAMTPAMDVGEMYQTFYVRNKDYEALQRQHDALVLDFERAIDEVYLAEPDRRTLKAIVAKYKGGGV